MPLNPILSVVIPTLNADKTIQQQIHALVKQTDVPIEVIIADNGSTDRTSEIVQHLREVFIEQVRAVDASSQRGAAYARNVGASAARAGFLAFCDADDVVGPNWCKAMVDGLKTSDVVAGPTSTSHSEPVIYRGGPALLPSGSLGVRADAFERMGGFDARWRRGEDIDFSIRAARAGLRCEFAPDAWIERRQRPSLRSTLLHGFSIGYWDALVRRHHRESLTTNTASIVLNALGWVLARGWYVIASHKKRMLWLKQAAKATGLVAGLLTPKHP